MNIRNIFKVLLISMCILATQAHSLGYVSRACPYASALESFTMSWTSNQFMLTRAYLPKLDFTSEYGYKWERWDSSGNYGVWDYTKRSAAGIHPWILVDLYDYLAAIYSFHYWYNFSTHKVEKQENFTTSCNVLNWGVNNW